MDAVDCRLFEDQLDAAASGGLPPAGWRLLRAHAAVCDSCTSLLALHDHVRGPSLDELEKRVPDAWISGMEDAVRRSLASRPPVRRVDTGGPVGRRMRWVPLLAAAVVALLLSTGLSLRALERSREREQVLAGQLLDQQRRLAALEAPTASLRPGSAGLSRDAWFRALEQRSDMTLAELQDLLARVPDHTTLLSARQTRELAGSRWVPSPWREAFQALGDDSGATAADLRLALERIGLPDDRPVPTRRLLDLLG